MGQFSSTPAAPVVISACACVKSIHNSREYITISTWGSHVFALEKSNPAFIPLFERLALDKTLLFKYTEHAHYPRKIITDIAPTLIYEITTTVRGSIDISHVNAYLAQTQDGRDEPHKWELLTDEEVGILATDGQRAELRPNIGYKLHITWADRHLSNYCKILKIVMAGTDG